jgi:diguanylate cyclase (GGDEF)-like protein
VAGAWLLQRQRHATLTAQRELARLERISVTDPLTGLGNHRAFLEEMRREVSRAQRHEHALSLALVDLDYFKVINDTHGHVHGDRVLKAVAELLGSHRAEDRAFRIGGDEFAVLLPHTAAAGTYTTLERKRAEVERTAGVTMSVGIAELEGGSLDVDRMREQADAALYEAKRRGRDAVVLFEEIKGTAAFTSPDKVQSVRQLLSDREVGIVFQPIWSLRDGRTIGHEALARPAEHYGLRGPAEAFDVVEKIGRVPELDGICRDAVLAHSGALPQDGSLFLNVAPQTLETDVLAGRRLVDAVEEVGLPPERVVLEVAERSPDRLTRVAREAARLRSLGFRIALDDVGGTQSGLGSLWLVEADYVKIDQSVTRAAVADMRARALLSAIVSFARRTEATVIAEGIDSEAMLRLVGPMQEEGLSVDAVQGYLLGEPSDSLPLNAAARLDPAQLTLNL